MKKRLQMKYPKSRDYTIDDFLRLFCQPIKSALIIVLFLTLSLEVSAQIQIGDAIEGSGLNDYFGIDISMDEDGSRMAVGSKLQVSVFENQSGTWVQLGADLDAIQNSGGTGVSSLCDDGNIIAVGAPKHDIPGTSNIGAGQVIVYELQSGTWTQIGQELNGASGSWFGSSVGLSADGTTMVVGSTLADVNGFNSGSARIYELQSGTWTQVGSTLVGLDDQDRFGKKVGISADGTIVAIAGNNSSSITLENSGYVKVYELQSGTWTQLGQIIEGEAAEDYSGGSISLSADGLTIAIGAGANDGNGTSSGHTRVYEYSTGTWSQVGQDIDGAAAGDGAGIVSMSDDATRLVIGATGNDDGANQAGHARVFELQTSTWVQVGLDIDGENEFDFSGLLGLSGDGEVLGFGEYRFDNADQDAGRVRVFGGLDNQPPTVANPLADIVLIQGFGTHAIDVTNVFTDPNGDALNYSASSSSTGVTTVSMNRASLTITEGTKLGTTDITVTANDGDLGEVTNTFTITVEEPDIEAPYAISYSPADGAIDVARDGVYEITFNEEVVKKSGFIRFFNAAGTLRKTVSMAAATINGATMTIDPSQTFSHEEEINIRIDAGAVEDISGNDFAGISDPTTWNFTTINAPEVSLNSTSIDENEPTGTVVGILSTIDAEDGKTYTYNLASGDGDTDNASFTVNGDELRSNEVFDFEVKSVYSVRIYTFDGSKTFAKSFTITINDVSEPIVWNGTSWSNSTGPGAGSDDVIINGDYSVDTDGYFDSRDLTVNSGSTLTVDGDNPLIMQRNLINNGSIVVESGSSLVTYSPNTITGNDITFKRNTRYADGRYSFVGSPVQQDMNIVGSDLGNHVYKYNEATAYGADGINRWEDASADELVPGKGYTQADQQEIVFTGMPNQGTITIDGTFNEVGNDDHEGWMLVSNPYPAPIDVADFLSGNTNTNGSIYIWDDNGSDSQRGTNSDYIVANGTMATNTTPAGGQTRYDQTMGSMQGFFVKLNGAADVEIEFREDMRVTSGNTDDHFFRATALPIARINLTNNDGLFKQTLIGLAEDATNNEVNRTYDGQAFNSTSDNGLFTMKAGRTLSLNGMTSNWEVVQLQLNTAEAGIYQISVELEEYDQSIYLRDNVTGDITDLRSDVYTFNSQAGIDTDRFELISSPSNVLALEDKKVLVYASNSVLHIQQEGSEAREYQLFNMKGQMILSRRVESHEVEIDLSRYSKGIYLVFDGQKTHKIILD